MLMEAVLWRERKGQGCDQETGTTVLVPTQAQIPVASAPLDCQHPLRSNENPLQKSDMVNWKVGNMENHRTREGGSHRPAMASLVPAAQDPE